MTDSSIPILLEQPHFLVVDKPAGLFSQAPAEIPSLQQLMINQLRARDAHPGNPFIGLPHRLDRPTSGAMLIARNARALKRFGQQFQSRKIGKFYLAIVEGQMPSGIHTWRDYLAKVDNEPRAILVSDSNRGREAVSQAVTLARGGGLSLLLIQLNTGRMHQIRLQAAARGTPVLGDALYGAQQQFAASGAQSGLPQDDTQASRLALHSLRIEFRHPQTAVLLSGTAPLPYPWRNFAQDLLDTAEQVVHLSRLQSGIAWQLEQVALQPNVEP